MQNERIVWRNSIFTRLVVTFLLVMIPFYFLGIQIFSWSRGMLSREIFNSMQSQVTLYLNNFDNDIKRIQKLQYDCFDDDNLNKLANAAESMSDYEKTRAITSLQQHITSIKSSSVYIQNVSIHIPSIDRTINSFGTIEGSIADMSKDIYKKFLDAPVDSDSQMLYMGGSLYLNAPLITQVGANNSPHFFIEIQLSRDALKSTFLATNSQNGVKSVLMNPTQKFAITSDSDEKTSKEFQELLGIYKEKKENDAISVTVSGKKYLLTYAYSQYSGMILSRYIPEEIVFKPLKSYQTWFWAFSALAVIIIFLYSISTYSFIQKPMHKLIKAFRKVENGDLNVEIKRVHEDEFKYLYSCFNDMIGNLKNLIDQVYKQKILAQKAELKQLQSQIKPHFLYNSFFILQRRISKGDYENAERFCESLGTYFRFITRSASDEVDLAKEVEHARTFTEIQSIRFSNRIAVDFGDIPADCENLIVPRLILQPIIENAFEHGLENKEENGILKIGFFKEDDLLKIYIEDNGDDLSDSEIDNLKNALKCDQEGMENTGIINIHKRIHLAMGDNSGVYASRSELGGLKVELILEVKEKN